MLTWLFSTPWLACSLSDAGWCCRTVRVLSVGVPVLK